MSAGSSIAEGGFIGLSRESVGIDRRIYTGRTDTNPTLPVSYNAGRVEVYLNGIRLVGNHTEMGSTYDYTFTGTGSGSSIQLQTGIQLTSSDVIECIGYVSNSANTVTTYNPTVSAGDNTFTGINHSSSDLLNVYLNGVLLDSSDYTASPGTASSNPNTVAITALASGDVVAIQVIQALAHNDFVPASGGDFTGNVTTTGEIHTDDIKEKTSAHGVEIDGVTLKDGGGTFNRGTDGESVSLQKSASTVGTIGVSSDGPAFGTATQQIALHNGKLFPAQAYGSALDNTMDLGYSSSRFKDLYLSGNVVIDTSGKGVDFSATGDSTTKESELLNNYEKGYFQPVFTAQGNSVTITPSTTYNKLYYNQIGETMNISGAVNIVGYSGGTAPSGTAIWMTLPVYAINDAHTANGEEYFAGFATQHYNGSTFEVITANINELSGNNILYIRMAPATLASSSSGLNKWLYFSFNYRTIPLS